MAWRLPSTRTKCRSWKEHDAARLAAPYTKVRPLSGPTPDWNPAIAHRTCARPAKTSEQELPATAIAGRHGRRRCTRDSPPRRLANTLPSHPRRRASAGQRGSYPHRPTSPAPRRPGPVIRRRVSVDGQVVRFTYATWLWSMSTSFRRDIDRPNHRIRFRMLEARRTGLPVPMPTASSGEYRLEPVSGEFLV
jgi:hypothetical protein